MFATMLTALAAAAVSTPSTTAGPTAAPTPKAQTSMPVARARRYCVETYITGSRIPKRECLTRAEWLKDGFDPLAPE